MKANGMRAWRQTARRWRRKQNRHFRETEAPCIADGTGRWYRRQRAWFHQRPTMPPRPFSPRSLVGMSQGARKRAAKFDAWHKAVTYGHEVITRALRRCIASDKTTLRVENVAAEYVRQRRRYRIGERLRPCRWCGGPEAFEACRGKRIAQEVVGAHRRGECVFCRTCADAKLTLRVPNPDACNGSGVLPARRAKS